MELKTSVFNAKNGGGFVDISVLHETGNEISFSTVWFGKGRLFETGEEALVFANKFISVDMKFNGGHKEFDICLTN